jgi:hypothetical protein
MWRRWHSAEKDEFPSYSLLKAAPSRGLPQELAGREVSADYEQWRDLIESDLFAQATSENEPGFVTFLKSGNGLLQIHVCTGFWGNWHSSCKTKHCCARPNDFSPC